MSQPTPAQVNALLSYAATRLGVSPEDLRAALVSGNYDNVRARLSDSNRQAFEALLADPQKRQALLDNPQIQALLERYR